VLGGWIIACASLTAWIVLLLGRGGFWRPVPRLDASAAGTDSPSEPPSVLAIVPARNEADILGKTLPSVLGQHYGGRLRVVLVDDRSDDGTAEVAREAARASGQSHRLTLVEGAPLPDGWAGKVWAMRQGEALADDETEFIWLTDADIAHDPTILQALVDKARTGALDLVSLMAQLPVIRGWDWLLIPAFVYFFAKLYPFRLVSNPQRSTAGAAGGCILVRRAPLEAAGGIESIRSALIDDCALGKLIKRLPGRTWLGFTNSVRSVRGYGTLRSVWNMVARSAFHQLDYSYAKLAGTIVGMLLIYAAPPATTAVGVALALRGVPGAQVLLALGICAWGLMSISFAPILHHQHSSRWLAPVLPVAGVLYTAMTISSAWRHAMGRGGMWKGRTFTET
jgi:hopene-associated glycosyltransferase HpnB